MRVDGFENTASVLQHVIVPEAKNRKALRPQESVAPLVVFTFRVLRSVGFDDEPALEADKVDDVRIDDELPFEFERGHASVAQHRPEALLSIRRIEAHFSCKHMK